MRSCELCVFLHDEKPSWTRLEAMPTICLIALQKPFDNTAVTEIVKGCVSVGAILFAVYGDSADEMEEQIDFVLENGNEAWSNIITTSHSDETAEDMAHFFVNTAYRDDSNFRCLVIVDMRIRNAACLLQEINNLCAVLQPKS